MEVLNILDDICAKKDLSNNNRKQAVTVLLKMSDDINNANLVVEYLIKLHYSACPAYFNRAATELRKEQLSAVVEAFLVNQQFQKDKPQNFLYPKGFGSVLSLAKAAKYEHAFSILNYILMRSESGSQFVDGCKNNFKKTVIDANGLSSIQKLYEVVNADAFEAKPLEKRRFQRFLEAVPKTVMTVVEVSTVSSSIVAQPITVKDDKQVHALVKNDEKSKHLSVQIPQGSLTKIESTQSEILSVLQKLIGNRTAIDNLSLQIQKKDSEIAAAQVTIREREQQLNTLSLELRKSKTALSSAENQIIDLTERLKISFDMDERSRNQEIITLKNDISEALNLDYSDFSGTISSEYGPDLFEAYRATLTRIFKLLKRFGITCE